METAGKEDMPEDAERKGLGTPATRAGILEKLVSAGFLERKKSKKTVQLMPSHDAVSLITVLPEQLQSPLLTAEWEYRLGEIERGELAPEEFHGWDQHYAQGAGGNLSDDQRHRVPVHAAPRGGGQMPSLRRRSGGTAKRLLLSERFCKFAIWKNNKWWAAKKKQPTKAVVTALLKDGRAHVTGCIPRKPARPTMPLWFWRTMDSTPTSSWNLTSGKEADDEALPLWNGKPSSSITRLNQSLRSIPMTPV